MPFRLVAALLLVGVAVSDVSAIACLAACEREAAPLRTAARLDACHESGPDINVGRVEPGTMGCQHGHERLSVAVAPVGTLIAVPAGLDTAVTGSSLVPVVLSHARVSAWASASPPSRASSPTSAPLRL